MPLPIKVKRQVSLMKIAIEQAEVLESLCHIPSEEDLDKYNNLKESLKLQYADTMQMIAENMFEIADVKDY